MDIIEMQVKFELIYQKANELNIDISEDVKHAEEAFDIWLHEDNPHYDFYVKQAEKFDMNVEDYAKSV